MKFLSFSAFLLFALALTAPAQVIISNSLVTYTYQDSPANTYVPAAPLTSEVPYSSLAFAPNNFVASTTGSGMQIDSQTGILTVDMSANSGRWFTGTNALALDVTGSYSLFAPFASSEAFTGVTASYTLYLQGVDGVAFTSTTPLNGSLVIAPTNAFSLVGPGGVSSGQWNSSISLDINTIKAHFGIAPASNVTGLRLQYSSTLSVGSINGAASIDTLNVNITNQVIPEPSTYALLLMSGVTLAYWARRRR